MDNDSVGEAALSDSAASKRSYGAKVTRQLNDGEGGEVVPEGTEYNSENDGNAVGQIVVSETERSTDSVEEWLRSSYTHEQDVHVHDSLESPLGSVYSIEFRASSASGRHQSLFRNVDNRVSPSETDLDENLPEKTNLLLGRLPPVWPPVGHHGDYKHCIPTKLRDFPFSGSGRSDPEDQRAEYYEEKLTQFDDTALGKVFVSLGLDESLTLGNKEERKQARNAIKLADSLVSVPLSKVWHVLTEVLTNILFFLNIAVAAADIIQGPQYLYFKVTAFMLGLVENLCVVLAWAVSRHPKFKDSENKERFAKYQQYVENILSESLIYPLFILGILGFTTEKMYQSSGAFTYLQGALLIFDILTLIYNQILRLHMIRRLIQDLKGVLAMGTGTEQSTWKAAGYILPRCYWNVIGNFVVMLTLAALFGIQTNVDNYEASDYRLTLPSALIMILLIILPWMSLVLFFIVNMYWISEMLIKISLGVGSDTEFQDKLRGQYGDTLSDALHYSRSKIPASEKRLAKIQNSTQSKKLLFCLREIPFALLIFVFQWLVLFTVYSFSGFENANYNLIAKAMLMLLFIIANPHLSLLMLLSNFMVLALLLGAVAYPVCLPLMCKKQYSSQGKYSEITSEEKSE